MDGRLTGDTPWRSECDVSLDRGEKQWRGGQERKGWDGDGDRGGSKAKVKRRVALMAAWGTHATDVAGEGRGEGGIGSLSTAVAARR